MCGDVCNTWVAVVEINVETLQTCIYILLIDSVFNLINTELDFHDMGDSIYTTLKSLNNCWQKNVND